MVNANFIKDIALKKYRKSKIKGLPHDKFVLNPQEQVKRMRKSAPEKIETKI